MDALPSTTTRERLTAKDIQVIFGYGQTAAYTNFNLFKAKAHLEPGAPLTIDAFCKVTGMTRERVLESMAK